MEEILRQLILRTSHASWDFICNKWYRTSSINSFIGWISLTKNKVAIPFPYASPVRPPISELPLLWEYSDQGFHPLTSLKCSQRYLRHKDSSIPLCSYILRIYISKLLHTSFIPHVNLMQVLSFFLIHFWLVEIQQYLSFVAENKCEDTEERRILKKKQKECRYSPSDLETGPHWTDP